MCQVPLRREATRIRICFPTLLYFVSCFSIWNVCPEMNDSFDCFVSCRVAHYFRLEKLFFDNRSLSLYFSMRTFSSASRSHLLLLLLSLFSLGMLSSFGARAFSTVARNARFTATRSATARFMSSEPDTSVVDTCTQKIGEALETSDVKVTGAYDDPNGSHISIEVVSSKFEGKRAMQRQQMVYKAIWDELQGPVHAGRSFENSNDTVYHIAC